MHAADETLAHTQKAPRDGSMLPYLRYPAAWRLFGVMAKAGLPERRDASARSRRSAPATASTSPGARA